MFFYELQQFLLLSLGQVYGFADEGRRGSRFEFYGMVPGSRRRELSFLSLFEYISVIPILERDIVQSTGFLLSAYEDSLSGK